MDKSIFSLDFSDLSKFDASASIEGQIVLSDNLDDSLNIFISKNPKKSFPIQTKMTINLVCTSGEMEIRVALKEYKIRQKSICVIITGTIFEIISISEDYKGFMIAAKNDFMQITDNAAQIMSIYNCLRNTHCFTITEEELLKYINIYRVIKTTMQESEHPFKMQILQSYIKIIYYQLMPVLLKESELQLKRPRTRQEEIFERFISEVEVHYNQERSIKFYADRLCISPKYLSSVIYKVSQRLAGEWIEDYVILEAKTLLKSGKLSIQQISEELNFANQSFFGKFFKRYVGISPKEYKNN
ncbi:MAG: AraC family transcriptional regulator [Bacteroidales bacterium]